MSNLGYVYVLANSAMPGMVKVGKTNRSPETRAAELSSVTGLPTPFIVVYQQLFEDCSGAEVFVHTFLERQGFRISENREFFNAPVHLVVKALAQAPGAVEENGASIAPIDRVSGTESAIQEASVNSPWLPIFEEAEARFYGLGDMIQSTQHALTLYRQAAKLGGLPAYGRIGSMYANGEGVEQDGNKALESFSDGADRGSFYCLWAMGDYFLRERHLDNAEECFSRFLRLTPDLVPDGLHLTSSEVQDIYYSSVMILRDHRVRATIPVVPRAFKIFVGQRSADISRFCMKLEQISNERGSYDIAGDFRTLHSQMNLIAKLFRCAGERG